MEIVVWEHTVLEVATLYHLPHSTLACRNPSVKARPTLLMI
jgi:hypothetical protein